MSIDIGDLVTSGPVRSRRDAIFQETPRARLQRWAFGLAWAVMPKRVSAVPDVLRALAIDCVATPRNVADLSPKGTAGIAGVARSLSPSTLSEAYARGLFPFAHLGPLKWWSPPQRSLLFFEELHIAKRLRRQMRQGRYRVTFDRDIEGVLTACAATREGRLPLTWITPRIMHAYGEAFDAGLVHSFEVWNERGELAGGGYGVAVGGTFSTESQFSREPNTSKIGFTALNYHLSRWGFAFNDGKHLTPTTRDMGFREVPRGEYLARLDAAVGFPGKAGRWSAEAGVRDVAEWRPGSTTEINAAGIRR